MWTEIIFYNFFSFQSVKSFQYKRFILTACFSVHFHVDKKEVIHGKIILVRKLDGFIITTALPSIIANVIGHTTNYFDEDSFDVAIGVNLTILLVLTTM